MTTVLAVVNGKGGVGKTTTAVNLAALLAKDRSVLEPGEDAMVEPGEILVCRFTAPSWAPLFTLAEALVIDIGGPASHGAIVARELGVPCVIGTGDGTARIRSGDHLRVDGTAGVVHILSRTRP